jgi:hypothetical protein
MVTLCLAGPEAEREFCGPISDNSDRTDYKMARDYLARHIANPLQAAAEFIRHRDAAPSSSAVVERCLVDHVCDPAVVRANQNDSVIAFLDEKQMGSGLRHLIHRQRRQRV